jgi:hypothetical protein
MNRDRKRGVRYSGIMHGILLLIAIIGLPDFFFQDDIEEPAAITVDILPIAAVSNVKMSEATPSETKAEEEKKDKDTPKPEEKPAEKEKASPKVNTSKETPPPPPPPEEKAPDIKKKEEKKPEKKTEEKKKEDPLDAILKSVRETAANEKSDKPKPTTASSASASPTRSRSNNFDPNAPEAMSLRDAIQAQIYKCWNVPAGVKDAEKMIIPLEIDYDKTGMPQKVALASGAQSKYDSDAVFRSAADSAIRAVRACAPLTGLPPENYSIWQYIDMNFNPKDMLL